MYISVYMLEFALTFWKLQDLYSEEQLWLVISSHYFLFWVCVYLFFFFNWYLVFKPLYVVRYSRGPLISLKDRLNVFLRKGDIMCYYSVIPGYTLSLPLWWCTPSQSKKQTWPYVAVRMEWRRRCSTPSCGADMPKTFLPGWRKESAWVNTQLSKGNSSVTCKFFVLS